MDRRFYRFLVFIFAVFLVSALLWGCGYPKEEKRRMEELESQGRENAVGYVEEKYGFTPEVKEVRLCMELDDGQILPWANGYVRASMSHGGKDFQVHISGEGPGLNGGDDYQRQAVMEDAREYFQALLGYEIYDIYLEYKEPPGSGSPSPGCHEDYFLRESYEPGGFEELLRRCLVNLRIDDCLNQDLTALKETNPEAAAFFEACARDYGMQAVLISYKSPEDYQKGYEHTYGRGGLLDFEIWEDGLYIASYAAFEEDGKRAERFELQEYEGLVVCCFDKAAGHDLLFSAGKAEWLDLGETYRKPLSQVYSVEREGGVTVLYIPTEVYGKGASVFIQHFYKGRWWQYEAYTHLTRDKKYVVATFRGISEGSFDFTVTLP